MYPTKNKTGVRVGGKNALVTTAKRASRTTKLRFKATIISTKTAENQRPNPPTGSSAWWNF